MLNKYTKTFMQEQIEKRQRRSQFMFLLVMLIGILSVATIGIAWIGLETETALMEWPQVNHIVRGDAVDATPEYYVIMAYVTAFNTVPAQTDNNPCISASGANICGRDDVIACSREYAFGTEFEILGHRYICEDRPALRYDDIFDISFDKDFDQAFTFGKKYLPVKVFFNN